MPHEIGTSALIESVSETVTGAIDTAWVTSMEDMHLLQVKCPLLTADYVSGADQPVATTDTLKSMELSRCASALGVALALGEIDGATAKAALIGGDPALWSARASAFGVELMGQEVLVLRACRD